VGFFDTISAAFSGSSGPSVSEITSRAAADRATHATRASSPYYAAGSFDPFGTATARFTKAPEGATSAYSGGGGFFFGGPAASVSYPAVPDRSPFERMGAVASATGTRYPAIGERYDRGVMWSDTAPRPVAQQPEPSVGDTISKVALSLADSLPRAIFARQDTPGAQTPVGSGGGLPTWALVAMGAAVLVGVVLVVRK